MNKFLYLLITLLIPITVGILGYTDNTSEFSYPFILGFLIALCLFFPKIKEVENCNHSEF